MVIYKHTYCIRPIVGLLIIEHLQLASKTYAMSFSGWQKRAGRSILVRSALKVKRKSPTFNTGALNLKILVEA